MVQHALSVVLSATQPFLPSGQAPSKDPLPPYGEDGYFTPLRCIQDDKKRCGARRASDSVPLMGLGSRESAGGLGIPWQ